MATKRALTAVATASSARAPAFWLLKSEPADYSISNMQKEGRTVWDGVRSAQARKHLRAMAVGDRCLFYHSSCGAKTGVAGVVTVARAAYPDPADANWAVVDVQHEETWSTAVTLPTLKEHKDGALSGMVLFAQSRLSVQPVSDAHYAFVLSLRPPDDAAAPAKRAKSS